jgi:large subunit ribosomal protein L10
MNRDEKAAVVDQVAAQIEESQAIIAVDYRGITVSQVAELRAQLREADATLRVIKNRLTARAVEKAGAKDLEGFLEGPTAFTFIRGDAAAAAKALATFRKEHDLLEFKGGTMDGAPLTVDEILAISKLPSRDTLNQQLVGVLAHPISGLARTLNQLIQGLAVQLGQIAEQGLVTGEPPAPEPEPEPEAPAEEPAAEEAPAEEAEAPAEETPEADAAPDTEASGEEPAETDESDAPSEGEETKEG